MCLQLALYLYHTTWKNKSQHTFISYCFAYNTKSLHDFNHFSSLVSKILEWSNQKVLTSLRLRSLLCLLHFYIYDFHIFYINPPSNIRLPRKNSVETAIFNTKKMWSYIKLSLSSSGFTLLELSILT